MGKENQSFKQVIQSYLEQRAKRDSLFATSFAKQNKNIDECCNNVYLFKRFLQGVSVRK